jgi:hypothetical protein
MFAGKETFANILQLTHVLLLMTSMNSRSSRMKFSYLPWVTPEHLFFTLTSIQNTAFILEYIKLLTDESDKKYTRSNE